MVCGIRAILQTVDEPRGPILRAGQRVRVMSDPLYGPGPWPAEPMGTVVEYPGGLDGETWRPIMTTSGPRRFYWIVFDEPQLDGDGDGPYAEAEVLDDDLELVH